MKSSFNRRVLLLGLPLLAAGPVWADKVVVEFDKDTDFTRYKSYDWKEHPFLKSRPESKQFTVGMEMVQSNVNDILMKRGYIPGEPQPDFFITQFITARIGQAIKTVPATEMYPNAYMWPGAWYSWSSTYFTAWDSYVENYAEGILILDFVDGKTNKLIWRAACKERIDEMKERHKNVEDAVKKALKSFPPKSKKKS